MEISIVVILKPLFSFYLIFPVLHLVSHVKCQTHAFGFEKICVGGIVFIYSLSNFCFVLP